MALTGPDILSSITYLDYCYKGQESNCMFHQSEAVGAQDIELVEQKLADVKKIISEKNPLKFLLLHISCAI